MAIKHKYTIVCDEVRREDNGKLIIIGVYQKVIAIPQLPFMLPTLTFFQSLESDRPGTWSLRIKIQHLETGKNLLEGMGQMTFQQPGEGVNQLKFGNVPITALGAYNFVIDVEGQNEPIITAFEVQLNIPQSQQQQQVGFAGR